jgi:hypothetical protein
MARQAAARLNSSLAPVAGAAGDGVARRREAAAP